MLNFGRFIIRNNDFSKLLQTDLEKKMGYFFCIVMLFFIYIAIGIHTKNIYIGELSMEEWRCAWSWNCSDGMHGMRFGFFPSYWLNKISLPILSMLSLYSIGDIFLNKFAQKRVFFWSKYFIPFALISFIIVLVLTIYSAYS